MATLNITIPDADESTKGIAEVATQAETNTGTDDTRILTPLKLEQSDLVQTTVAANTLLRQQTRTIQEMQQETQL